MRLKTAIANVQVSMPLQIFDRNQGAIAQACGELVAAQAALDKKELELEQRLATRRPRLQHGPPARHHVRRAGAARRPRDARHHQHGLPRGRAGIHPGAGCPANLRREKPVVPARPGNSLEKVGRNRWTDCRPGFRVRNCR